MVAHGLTDFVLLSMPVGILCAMGHFFAVRASAGGNVHVADSKVPIKLFIGMDDFLEAVLPFVNTLFSNARKARKGRG